MCLKHSKNCEEASEFQNLDEEPTELLAAAHHRVNETAVVGHLRAMGGILQVPVQMGTASLVCFCAGFPIL